ncbi:Sodium- and chloride-dependent glycine transporter 2 [Trichinella nativa]|uniref:Sodium-and chloride-dependent glycine transporter 2 n=1 Tax=Trichinella nativa TaxID=6335 RepID=A0A0V1L6T8_9BILA|nr:Sodium- and chloride-dependent glycine transporter 2 [Trichinella nativa]
MKDEQKKKTFINEKDKWASATEFMLSCLGYAVGLGNIWRFPYLCGRNGGAAFFLIFIFIIIIAGTPMAYLELGLGQYSSLASHQLFESLCPLFSGLGYVMVLTSFMIALYYNVILCWAIYYFAASFSAELPWNHCYNSWNTDACFDKPVYDRCIKEQQIYWRGRCHNESDLAIGIRNASNSIYYWNTTVRSNPSQEYFEQVTFVMLVKFEKKIFFSFHILIYTYSREVLQISDGIDNIGTLNGNLSICLLAAWVMVFAILIRGIKSAGKVIYVLATVPYILLLVLLIRGLLLTNSMKGIEFFLIPDFSRLTSSEVWGDAAIQVFFSMSIGAGGLSTLASYSPTNNNILRDTVVITIGNIFTSLLSGLVVFSILGYISGQLDTTVEQIAESGPGLLFVAYPYALSSLPVSQLWSSLFFFTVILMAIDTQVYSKINNLYVQQIVQVQVVITAIIDQWPFLRQPCWKVTTVAFVCAVSYLIGLIMVTNVSIVGGPYILNLLDTFAGGWPLLLQCLIEVIVVAYIFGKRVKKYAALYERMLGKAPSLFWKILGYPASGFYKLSWAFLTPACLIGVLIFNFLQYSTTTYGNYVYPLWAEILGWVIAFSTLLPVVLVALYKLIMLFASSTWVDAKCKFYKYFQATEKWHQNFTKQEYIDEQENTCSEIISGAPSCQNLTISS